MARKDEAVENFDDYLDGWFFRRPGMERMLDASKGEKAAKKAFDENFASLNDKMGWSAESQGGLKDVTDRRKMMLDTVEKENGPKIAEIDGKIKAHNDVVENLSKVESNGAVMMAELDDAGRRVDDAEKSVSEAEKRLNEARSEKEIRMRENAAKSGPAAWIGKYIVGDDGESLGLPYSIVRFSSGKFYNADLNAAYNIGARYYIRLLLDFLETRLSSEDFGVLLAKVPACSARSRCVLADLISLWGVACS